MEYNILAYVTEDPCLSDSESIFVVQTIPPSVSREVTSSASRVYEVNQLLGLSKGQLMLELR